MDNPKSRANNNNSNFNDPNNIPGNTQSSNQIPTKANPISSNSGQEILFNTNGRIDTTLKTWVEQQKHESWEEPQKTIILNVSCTRIGMSC